MDGKAVLISIHPEYSDKIVTGEKKIEFRRRWAVRPVEVLYIYSTFPVQRIVAIAEVKQVYIGTPNRLWNIAKLLGGCISRRNLFSYLSGKKNGVGIELSNIVPIIDGIDPKIAFGKDFRPPQSFRYLKDEEYTKITNLIGA